MHQTYKRHYRIIRNMKRKLLFFFLLQIFTTVYAQEKVLSDLSRHDFFYAGESKQQRMFIVKNGAISWQWKAPKGRGEISDAVLMTDGHILIAHQYGICEVTQENKTLWGYEAPKGTEIHTIQPIGQKHVLFVQNGKPAKVVVMEIPECRIVHEFEVPASEGVHGQFRNARLSSRGTLLLAHMSQGYVAEYSVQGNELGRWEIPSPWSVTEYANDRMLFVGRGLVREIDRGSGLDKVVREIKTADYGIKSPQKAVRLKNGNTIINDWWSEWSKTPLDSLNPPVQAIEIDKEGKVVWQLCSWKAPDLGPSTTIQPLDQSVNRDHLSFGHFNGRQPKQMLGVNEPIGIGRGIHPGRVAWIHSPGVAKWDGRTGLWVEDRWNDQKKADNMITEAIRQVSGEKTAKKGWQALLKHFNKKHGRGNRGYKKGEMIAVKLNLNNALTHRDTFELNSSPFVTLALVRSMVNDGGIREQDIVLCEPSRAITDSIYNKVHREFPQVRFIDNMGGDGREKCEYYPEMITYSQDNGKLARGLAKCIVDADYLINSSLLKTHVGPGVTLTTKNLYGATDISLFWRNNAHNGFNQDKRHGKPGYKTFVDWLAHKHLGQKVLLSIIDGTYGSRHVNGKPFPKWQKEPFNNDWCCSIIVSQDEVACDAVGMDLIISEWPEYNSLNYCDEYLIEAASQPNPPSRTIYKQDGQPLNKSLGLMEHCDKDRKYTKIDLKYVNQSQNLLVPAWSLGHIIWEDSINTEQGAQRLYDEYAAHQIPVDGIIIDSPWTVSYNDFNWDRQRYPHAEQMIRTFNNNGVKVILWLTGCVNTVCKDTPKQKAANYDEAYRLRFGINDNTPSKWWKGKGLMTDFTNPKAREWWYTQLDKVFTDGVYGFKVDQGEIYFGDTVNTSVGRMTNREFRKYYYDAISDYVRMRKPEGITIGRPYSHQGGFHSTPEKMIIGWCGDFGGDWKGLKLQIDNIYRSAQAGFGAVGCEVAGFMGAKATRLDFIRYTQFGAMTACMINGGENGAFSSHLPWYHGDDISEIYRQCVVLHNQLRPYMFSVLVDAHLHGGGLLRRTSLEQESHLLGNDIFTKAITNPEGKAVFTLPEDGEWVDYFSGESYLGGTQLTKTYPIDRFPLFIRKGAIIPLAKDSGIVYLVCPKGTTTRKFYLPTGDGTDYEECDVSYSESDKMLRVNGKISNAVVIYK